jgi:ubiquinone/menaquinone biosynthesis C-methylase UbiE
LKNLPEIKDIEQFKFDDASSYDSYADDYHHYIDKLCEPFAKQMVNLAHLQPWHRVLDVGTGTGIIANYAARLIDNSVSVFGIDLSEGMLKKSILNAKKLSITNVQFHHMDAENLELPSESFDSVISMYAIDHFPNAAQALKEMHRVLKPGGRLVVSMGCRIPPWGGGLLKAYCVGIVRRTKQIFQPNLYAPNFILHLQKKYFSHLPSPPHSHWGGLNPGRNLLKLIKESGFNVENTFWNHNMITIPSAEDFWRSQSAIVTEVRKQLQYATTDLKNLFYEEFKNLANAALSQGGKLYYCVAIFIVSGIRK